MDFRRTLSAGVVQQVGASGNNIFIKESDFPVLIEVAGRREFLSAGEGLRLKNGERFKDFYATSANGQDVVFFVGADEFESKRVAGSVQSTMVKKTTAAGYAADSLIDTDVVILPVNGSVIIKSRRTSTGTLWVSEAGAVSYGVPIEPGESLPINDFIGDLEIYSEGDTELCVLELSA